MEQPLKKLKHYDIENHVRFLTFSCFQRLPLFQNDAIKNAYMEHLDSVREGLEFRLCAWVIMPEHVHLLVKPNLPKTPISTVVWHLKRNFARRMIVRWRELDAPILPRLLDNQGRSHFWQHSAGFDRNIFSEHEFHEKIDYININPASRGLVEQPEQWKWSSARWYNGEREDTLRIDRP